MFRRSLCLILLLAVALSVDAGTPRRVGNTSSLMKALSNGAPVSVVLEYGRCELVAGDDPQFRPPLTGGLIIEQWDARVGGDPGEEVVTITLNGESLVAHPRRGMLRRHVEIEVTDEDRVAITLRHLDPATSAVVSTWRLATTFDRGGEGAAAFYRLD